MLPTPYDPTTLRLLLERIRRLQPDSPRRWGRMTVAQMLAHCCAVLEVALGERVQPPRPLSRLTGWLRRGGLASNTPFARNRPTHPDLVVRDPRDFATEQARLLDLLQSFAKAGPEGAPTLPHATYGKLSPTQWGGWVGKQLDHHLRQFGVFNKKE